MEKEIQLSPEYPFLKGGGKIGTSIAHRDWRTSILGPIESWPEELKIYLSMILQSKFPMVIFWGPELITFYNDAFRLSLGEQGKHPDVLGLPADKKWMSEWTQIEPIIKKVLSDGEAICMEDHKLTVIRNGQPSYSYWTCNYSPITNATGEIKGVLLTSIETTNKMESVEKLRNSAEELSFTIEAAELGTWELDPITGNLKSNDRLKDWFGLHKNDDIPLSLAIKVIANEDRQRVFNAINEALNYSNGSRYEATYTIIHPHTLQRRIVLAKGRVWFTEEGTAYRFNGTLQDITQAVQAQHNKEESDVRLKTIIEQAPVALALYEGKGRHIIKMANNKMTSIWGKDQSVLGQGLETIIQEMKGQHFFDVLDKIYETKEEIKEIAIPIELIVNNEQQTFYYDFTYQPILNTKGEVTEVLEIAEDVTQRIKSKRDLEEAALFATSIVDHSPIAKTVCIGYNMTLKTVNKVMLDLLGKDESIIGKTYEEVFPEVEHLNRLAIMRKVYTDGQTLYRPEERTNLIKNGAVHVGYYNYIYKALRNTNNEIYGLIITATNITEHVLARKKVEEAEIRLSSAVELANLSTWSIHIPSNKISYSPRLQEWLGIKEAIYDNQQTRVIAEDRERILAALKEAMNPNGNGRFDEVCTIVNVTNGHRRIIQAHAELTYDENNQPYILEGVAQDITLQKQAQIALEQEVQTRTEELASSNEELLATVEELANTNQSLTDINRQLEQYAYVASHDLQEPLRKIQVFSSLLCDRKNLEEIDRNHVDKINRAANRMRYLINDLLEFSRLMHSAGTMKKTTVDLNTIVAEVIDDFELSIQEKKAVLEINELPVIEATALQMNQLFYNLIGNALKFVTKGVQPKIKISARCITVDEVKNLIPNILSSESYWEISIQDNGIGIDAEDSEKIFEVFKRLHGRDIYSGSGIGLSVCRLIVNNHQGYLYYTSRVGEGSTFYILLPSTQK